MISNDSPLMNMLSQQMRFMSQRQGVLAHNIANADTPAYRAQDLKGLDFESMAKGAATGDVQFRAAGQLRQTSTKHMGGTLAGASGFRAQEIRDAMEITPVGNNVVLEEEMAKVSDTGAKFQISNSLMKKFTTMYRSALGNR